MKSQSELGGSNRRPVPVAGIMDHIVSSLGLSRRYYGWLAVSRWPEIVGEHYARHSRAFKFHDGVLFVAVNNDGWRQQLAMDNDKIMTLIYQSPHGRVVKSIRLVRGEKGIHNNGDASQGA